MEVLEALFARALRLESPWEISKVEFHEGKGIIEVNIDFPRGSVFCCPVCGKEVKAYDTTEKRWRHLNFFQYVCYLTVRVPRINCPDDGILQIDVPWAREGADFTVLFESFAMTLVREMPVNKVSQIINVDDNKLWRMMHYYTEAARRQEDYSGVKKNLKKQVAHYVVRKGGRNDFTQDQKTSKPLCVLRRSTEHKGGNPGPPDDVGCFQS